MLDKEIVAGWLGSMGVDDLQLILELIDCPENGLDAYASAYGPHPDTVKLIEQRDEARKALAEVFDQVPIDIVWSMKNKATRDRWLNMAGIYQAGESEDDRNRAIRMAEADFEHDKQKRNIGTRGSFCQRWYDHRWSELESPNVTGERHGAE